MIEARIPENEEARLHSLNAMSLLDTPMEERFERITRLTCRILGVPIAAVSLIDSNRQWFKSVQGLTATETTREVAFCAHTILEDDLLVVPDAKADERFADNPLVTGNPEIRFYAGQPLHAPDGSTVGSLCAIDRAPRELSSDDRQALRDLAAIVEAEFRASALSDSRKHLVTELDAERRRARIDALTQVWNRAGTMEILNREMSRAKRHGGPLAIIIADIDHFKRVNDTYGHPVGDEVLRGVARRLLEGLRPHDTLGRFGGEEFLLILPDCAEACLGMVAERLRNRLADSNIPTASGPIRVTASFGAVTASATGASLISEMVRLADSALYEAKQSGRNCIRISPEKMPMPMHSASSEAA